MGKELKNMEKIYCTLMKLWRCRTAVGCELGGYRFDFYWNIAMERWVLGISL